METEYFTYKFEEVPVTVDGMPMWATGQMDISFEVEPADPSVGIFDEYCSSWSIDEKFLTLELMDDDGEVITREFDLDDPVVAEICGSEDNRIRHEAITKGYLRY